MPQDYYSPYQEAAAGFERLGQVLPQIALGMAQRRYQQDLMRYQMDLKQRELASQMAVDRERVNLLRQQARNETAQTTQLGLEDTARGDLSHSLWNLGMIQGGQNQGIDMGNRQDVAIANALSAMGRLKDADRSKIPQNIAQMLQMSNPRMQQLMATDTPAVSNVPAEATQIDNATGVPMYYSDREIGRGVNLVNPQTGGTIAEGQPYSPGSNLSQLIGSLTRLRGQGMAFGTPVDPNNPMFKQAETGISQLLPQVLQQAGVTNVAPALDLGQPHDEAGDILPMPKDKNSLIKGKKYQTSRGVAIWDGTNFTQ